MVVFKYGVGVFPALPNGLIASTNRPTSWDDAVTPQGREALTAALALESDLADLVDAAQNAAGETAASLDLTESGKRKRIAERAAAIMSGFDRLATAVTNGLVAPWFRAQRGIENAVLQRDNARPPARAALLNDIRGALLGLGDSTRENLLLQALQQGWRGIDLLECVHTWPPLLDGVDGARLSGSTNLTDRATIERAYADLVAPDLVAQREEVRRYASWVCYQVSGGISIAAAKLGLGSAPGSDSLNMNRALWRRHELDTFTDSAMRRFIIDSTNARIDAEQALQDRAARLVVEDVAS